MASSTYIGLPGKFATGAASVLTLASGVYAVIGKIILCNNGAAACTFSIGHFKSATNWKFYKDVSLNPNETFEIGGPIHIPAGESLYAEASAADSIYYQISYLEVDTN